MGYMFPLTIETSSGPQHVDPDTQTVTALQDPHHYHYGSLMNSNVWTSMFKSKTQIFL